MRKPIAGRENEPGFLEQDAQRSDDRREVSGLRLGQRRIIKPALVLFGVAVLLGYALYLKQAASRRLLGEPRNLAILPLQNLKPDVDSDFLGFSLADARF